jgi:hypothetical protein
VCTEGHLKWDSLGWDEIVSMMAGKEGTDSHNPRFTTRLTLCNTLMQDAVVAGGRRSWVTLRFAQWLLPMPIEELVSRIRRYHEVITLSGFSPDNKSSNRSWSFNIEYLPCSAQSS